MKVRVLVELKADNGEVVSRKLRSVEVLPKALALYEAVGGKAGATELLVNDVITGALEKVASPGKLMEATSEAPARAPQIQDALGAGMIEGIAAEERRERGGAPMSRGPQPSSPSKFGPRPIGWGSDRSK